MNKIIFTNTNINSTAVIQIDPTNNNQFVKITVIKPSLTLDLTTTTWSINKLNTFLNDFVKDVFTLTDSQTISVQVLVDDVLTNNLSMTMSGVNYNINTTDNDVIMTITTFNVDSLIELIKVSNDSVTV